MKRMIVLGLLAAMCAGCAGISIPGGNLLPLLLMVKEEPPQTLPAQTLPDQNGKIIQSATLFPQDRDFFRNPELYPSAQTIRVAWGDTGIANRITEPFQCERERDRLAEIPTYPPLSETHR